MALDMGWYGLSRTAEAMRSYKLHVAFPTVGIHHSSIDTAYIEMKETSSVSSFTTEVAVASFPSIWFISRSYNG